MKEVLEEAGLGLFFLTLAATMLIAELRARKTRDPEDRRDSN